MAEYIEREQTISAIMRDCPELVYYNKKEAIWCIECIPAVDVAPVVHGHWINENFYTHCSVCNNMAIYDKYGQEVESDYCPRCGAKMDGNKVE